MKTNNKTKFSVTQFGKPLDKNKYSWNEETKTFISKENNLVLDFTNVSECTFDTGSYCTFKTGSYCTFKTGSKCTFDTGSDCTFKTGYNCTFKTGSDCTFKTGYNCTFDTRYNCVFKTGSDCTFDTGSKCVIIRRDVFEVITLEEETNNIKINTRGIKGFKHIIKYNDMTKEELIKIIKEK